MYKKTKRLKLIFIIYACVVRNRYVEYAAGSGKDASQIPSEWYR